MRKHVYVESEAQKGDILVRFAHLHHIPPTCPRVQPLIAGMVSK